MIHAKLLHVLQPFVHTGQGFGVHVLLGGFLAIVNSGPAVHKCGAWIEQDHDGECVMLMGKLHHALDHCLMA